MNEIRVETDSMGAVEVPAEAYYGAQTQRALENFSLSDWRFGRRFISSLGLIKWAAASINRRLGLLDSSLADTIGEVADEVVAGNHDRQFPVDVFQTGSGTSTNMNANEVIANRANQLLGYELGSHRPVHPNDHVNLCQSSNDVIPTATHLAGLSALTHDLVPALRLLNTSLGNKAAEFDHVVKSGRTHLMDATPVRLGQEFSGFAAQIGYSIRRVEASTVHLKELALGGTAVGTGINAHPEFASRTIALMAERLEMELVEAPNHFEAQSARDAVVEASAALRSAAISMARISNDLRWLASGPSCGIGEIRLPELQPGSSIMPGKVNPVIPEAVIQVAAQVIGNDATIALGGLGSMFQLNTMMPVMAHDLLFSAETLAAAARALATKCVDGIQADEKRCAELLEHNLSLVTALAPKIGYDAAAEVAKTAHATGRPLREVVLEAKLMSEAALDETLDVYAMTRGGLDGNEEREE